jgi:GTP-binding protein LepA
LHGEIVLERLSREFNLEILATSPSVSYLIQLRNGETITVYSSAQWPDPAQILNIQEPLVSVKLYTASEYLGAVLSLIQQRRGVVNQTLNVGAQLVLEITMPLSELITDFQDVLKSATSGYGSFEYEESGYALVDAVKVSILLNGELIDSLSFICVRESAQIKARAVTKKLKDVLPRQMFEVPIQAAIGGNIIARETLKAFRKDVTAKLYGGDATRRKKLLAKQAKGKKRMRQFGKVEIDHNTFLELLRT